MADQMSEARPIVGDPDLDPELRACIEQANAAMHVVADAAGRLPQPQEESERQILALGLYGTIIEHYSACLLLGLFSEPRAIPIILRSEYEALVDLDNLAQDRSYHCRIEHANIVQTLKIMSGGPLRKDFQQGRRETYAELSARQAELEFEGKASLSIKKRCKTVDRLNEYEGIYGLLCLDTHNNASALAERHLSEREDGTPIISIFGPYDPERVRMRLNFGLQWLFQAAHIIHSIFGVPAPEIRELAERFERERAKQLVPPAGAGS
jgi:hypothetical protein